MFLFIICGALGQVSVTVINHADSNCHIDNRNPSAQKLSKQGAVGGWGGVEKENDNRGLRQIKWINP